MNQAVRNNVRKILVTEESPSSSIKQKDVDKDFMLKLSQRNAGNWESILEGNGWCSPLALLLSLSQSEQAPTDTSGKY